ncbi:hypothetical protein TrST_g4300 [Triparma strigata]|uniref:Uncharacterized protein n=1 Tax=Triparma strigata TaxID=1606541 RepID=A0A9W7EDW8_9STRA|nr:hypothetical protein TrST_g4300 [Triparma strigata]
MKLAILSSILTCTTGFVLVPRPAFHMPLHATPDEAAKEIIDATSSSSWQDIWEYDGAMSNSYASHFVVGNWLKAMPCGAGLKDECPQELTNPGVVPADVDVMGFLGVKRAEPIKKAVDVDNFA